MGQMRDPGMNQGENSRANRKQTRKSKRTEKLIPDAPGKKKVLPAQGRKNTPAEPPQIREMRNKVKRVYLIIVAACAVVIVVFALLVANKLSQAGVILEPEETAQMIATIPGGESSGTEMSSSMDSSETSDHDPAEKDPSETDSSDVTVSTAAVQAAPVVKRTYSYGNVNIEGGLSVVTTTTTTTTTETVTSSEESEEN